MRFYACVLLTTALSLVALWYFNVTSQPSYDSSMLLVVALMTNIFFFNYLKFFSRPRRIIRETDEKHSRVIYDSHKIVARVGPYKWNREDFCTHWFVTGDTGVGKTLSGLNRLLISLTEYCPQWGGLILDPKGLYWATLKTILGATDRSSDLAVLRVRSPLEPDTGQVCRFNLIGDPSVPCSTYAQMIVDTHAAQKSGSSTGSSDFFNQRALEHISKCFELMRILELPFNLRTAYRLLANKDELKQTLDFAAAHGRAVALLPLVQHFETFYLNLKSEGQSEGEIATIANFLAPYQHPAVADVFCSDEPDTITIQDVDNARKICLSMSEEYARERKYIFTIVKLLFYQHGLRRLDLKGRDPKAFWRKNLLVLVGEEFQDVVTSSEGGMSDYTVSGKIREAGVSLIILTQSHESLLPSHTSKDQANVLVLNLRNRMIFRAADEACAKKSADFIGKKKVTKRSRSVGTRGATVSYQELEEYKVKPWELRKLPNFTAILIHSGRPGQFLKLSLKPLNGHEARPSKKKRQPALIAPRTL